MLAAAYWTAAPDAWPAAALDGSAPEPTLDARAIACRAGAAGMAAGLTWTAAVPAIAVPAGSLAIALDPPVPATIAIDPAIAPAIDPVPDPVPDAIAGTAGNDALAAAAPDFPDNAIDFGVAGSGDTGSAGSPGAVLPGAATPEGDRPALVARELPGDRGPSVPQPVPGNPTAEAIAPSGSLELDFGTADEVSAPPAPPPESRPARQPRDRQPDSQPRPPLEALAEVRARPTSAALAEKIYRRAKEANGADVTAGPGNGRVACAWAVNRFALEPVLGQKLGRNPNLVFSLYDAAIAAGWKPIPVSSANPGYLVLHNGEGRQTFTRRGDRIVGNQHVGVCANIGCTRSYDTGGGRFRLSNYPVRYGNRIALKPPGA